MHSDEELQPPTAGELKGIVGLVVVANLFAVIFAGYIPLSVSVQLCSEIGGGLSASELLKHLVGAIGCLLLGITLPASFGWVSIHGAWKAFQRFRDMNPAQVQATLTVAEGSPSGATLSRL